MSGPIDRRPHPFLTLSAACLAAYLAACSKPAGEAQGPGSAVGGAVAATSTAAAATAAANNASAPSMPGAAPVAGTGAGPGAGQTAGAGAGSSAAPSAAPAASAPPVSVTVTVARRKDLPVVLEGTGTATPTLTVEVRPQLTSVIRQVHVKEGQFVRRGQLLFTLDAAVDEANVARLTAQLARDEAALADAQRQFKRSRELLAQNFISQGAVDSSQTLVETQTAAVAASKAAVAAAKVPLSYARVSAPSGGRVGAITLYPGSSVQANVTPLVTITQLDPIDVSFTVPQRYLPDALKALAGDGALVSAELPEGAGKLDGRLAFVDNAVDAASGTVKVKARFANRDSKLWPGAFVRTTLTVRALEGAVVIPYAAIITNARGTIVYVVAEGKANLRPVQVLATQGEEAAVSGVRPGERVVLDGRQNLRPGSAVVERPREGGGGGRPGGGGGGAGGGGGGSGRAAGAGPSAPAAPSGTMPPGRKASS